MGKRTKKGIVCLECTHEFTAPSETERVKCPKCKEMLGIDTSAKRVFDQEAYFAWYSPVEDFQLLRFFHIRSKHKSGQYRKVCIDEVAQRWLHIDGRHTQRGLLRNVFGNYRMDSWVYHSSIEVRNDHPVYNIYPAYVLPNESIHPAITRNGFCGDYMGCTPFEIFSTLLKQPKGETLLKAGQDQLFKYLADGDKYSIATIEQYWASIKICLRNNYLVTDAPSYFDYLRLLEYFGKDLHSATYICPVDFEKEHDKLSRRKIRKRAAEEKAEKQKQILEDELLYQKSKQKFLGIAFTDGELYVSVLQSVKEFVDEGIELNHCVFSSDYHKKKESLLLSARVNGRRMETVEVSLQTLKVIQARGLNNCDTGYHDRIVKLVQDNMGVIRKAKSTKKKAA